MATPFSLDPLALALVKTLDAVERQPAVQPATGVTCDSGCDQPARHRLHFTALAGTPDEISEAYAVCGADVCDDKANDYILDQGGDPDEGVDVETLPFPGPLSRLDETTEVSICEHCRASRFEVAFVTGSGATVRIRTCAEYLAAAFLDAEKRSDGFVPVSVATV